MSVPCAMKAMWAGLVTHVHTSCYVVKEIRGRQLRPFSSKKFAKFFRFSTTLNL